MAIADQNMSIAASLPAADNKIPRRRFSSDYFYPVKMDENMWL
jgi:hypothetical protein